MFPVSFLSADVVVMNNVFDFYSDKDSQRKYVYITYSYSSQSIYACHCSTK